MVSFSPTLRFCIHQLFIYGAFSGSLEQIETTFCTGKPTKKTNPSEKELASTTRQMEATTRVPAGGGVTFCTPAPASVSIHLFPQLPVLLSPLYGWESKTWRQGWMSKPCLPPANRITKAMLFEEK